MCFQSACACVRVAAAVGWGGGRRKGEGMKVCQQNQKQERLIWPDKVDSVTNHSGLWSSQDPRLRQQGQRPTIDWTRMDESIMVTNNSVLWISTLIRTQFLNHFLLANWFIFFILFFCVRIAYVTHNRICTAARRRWCLDNKIQKLRVQFARIKIVQIKKSSNEEC